MAENGVDNMSGAESRGAKRLAALFNAQSNANALKCHRCHKTVYPKEKITSAKDIVFHLLCFSCAQCGTRLTTASHKTSVDREDKEIYCLTHVPKLVGKSLGLESNGVLSFLELSRIQQKMKRQSTMKGPHVSGDASWITHALEAQKLNKYGGKAEEQHAYPALLLHKRDLIQQKIRQANEELESKQRVEEGKLLDKFQQERSVIEKDVQAETENEWERRLKDITNQLDKQYTKKKGNNDYEVEKSKLEVEARADLEAVQTKKLRNRTLKVIAQQQEETSLLVDKQNEERMAMMKVKKKELEADLVDVQKELEGAIENGEFEPESFQTEEILTATNFTTEPPPEPAAPTSSKNDLYHNLTANQVFNDLDDYVVNIAETEQTTFTDLVQDLTGDLMSDLAKARAIFRWITIKDLNSLQFLDSIKDTPLGLLRGIKFGTETYHTLFKRLCSYAGLHCVEVKGRSKSVGYEPGMKFKEDMFKNTWNAVLIDGQWRLVQCNWGARHLVLNKDSEVIEKERTMNTKKKDKIRYQYDEHYFLCDPVEFIQEFYPDNPDWQLLPQPLTLEEFEDLPFVRSVFFHFGMQFKDLYPACVRTDGMGGAEVRIRVPIEIASDIVFHYQLRFAAKELRHETQYKGAKFDRFVFQSMLEDEVVYSVHVPCKGEFFLEIFANRLEETQSDEDGASTMPFRLKCACKFRIICNELKHKMHALPNCASGEWGPKKAERHFKLFPLSHPTAVINCEDKTEVRFNTHKALHFLIKLRMNGVDDHFLDQFVKARSEGEDLIIEIYFPQPGQYGLDVYARPDLPNADSTLSHACKYLINVAKVKRRVDLGPAKMENAAMMVKDKYGVLSGASKLGIKALSHKEGKIKQMPAQDEILFAVPQNVTLSYHFIREPDEEYRDHVVMLREEEGKLAKFKIMITKPGNYLLTIYGRKDEDPKIHNVCNYLMVHDPDNTLTRRKKTLQRGIQEKSDKR